MIHKDNSTCINILYNAMYMVYMEYDAEIVQKM